MPGHIYKRGTVGLVTRSGTLGYEAASQMKALGIGISTSVGIGGDPINGSSFVDILRLFEEDPETEAVMMIGEIGGPQEAEAAMHAKENMKKPVIGYVAGLTAPKGRRMGHAGAIIRAFGESAAEKVEIMKEAGLTVVPSPADLGATAARVLGGLSSAWRSPREPSAGRRRDPPASGAGAQALAREFDARLNPDDRPLKADGLREALRRPTRCSPRSPTRSRRRSSRSEPRRAGLVANFGVGFNNIDIEAAKARGIAVSNTPDVLTDATADLAMTLLLMVARRTGEGERHLRGGQWTGWRPTHMLGTHVTGKTLGLVGMGRIARAVAQRAHHGFGMRIIYHDPFPPPPDVARRSGAEPRADAREVLREADFVSLHCPATPETRHLMNRDRLALMRPDAFLVNTARGDVVDEAALVEALSAKRIAGAGLDVFEQEPQVTQALAAMDNVVLLPHLGSATTETRVAMGMRAFENLQLFFAGQPLRDRVV